MKLDVIMCVGHADVDRLFMHALTSCVKHFDLLNRVVVITPERKRVLERIAVADAIRVNIDVFEDCEVLPQPLAQLPGWFRQQIIKLMADQISTTRFVACMGADTVLLKPLRYEALFSDGEPVLYFNRYPHGGPHLEYERRRVLSVAEYLDIVPTRSLPLGDFIMDFCVFDTGILGSLRAYLKARHGEEPLLRFFPEDPFTSERRVKCGEWTLYAVYLLDVLGARPPVRNGNNLHVAQIHSQNDLVRFHFDANAVHFVDKSFDLATLTARLAELGLDGCFR